MFTKNFNAQLALYTIGKCDPVAQKLMLCRGENPTAISGNISTATWQNSLINVLKSNPLVIGANHGVRFGSGTTPPTVDDYTLSGNFVSEFSSSYVYTTEYHEDGTSIVKVVYTITSTASTDIVIGEIGLFGYANVKTKTATSYTNYSYMLERTVLDNPVTIPPGGVGMVTYTITIPPVA